MTDSSTGFDESEVGILEDSANDTAPEAPVDEGLLQELAVAEFPDAFGEGPSQPGAQSLDAEPEPAEAEAEGDEEVPEGTDEEPAETEEAPESQGRASRRIQQLVEQNKTIQAQAEQQLQAQQRQMYDYMEQMRAQYDQQMQQVVGQYQALLQSQQAREEEQQLDEVGKFKKGLMTETDQLVAERVNAALAPLQQQMQAQQQAQMQAQQRAEQKARLDNFTAQASRAREQVLMQGISDAFGDDDNSILDDMLLSYVAATNMPPDQAAMRFRGMLDKLYAARIKGQSKSSVKPKGQVPPPPASSGKRSATQAYRPSYSALTNAGYSDFIEWRDDGSPRLDEPK